MISYLCALQNKQASTVAMKLLLLFLQQEAPMILQSDNGWEFVAEVITELVKLWKDCKIVHGSPRHPQSQGSVKRANADVATMVTQWMEDEKSTRWSWGIQFIAHKKNNRYHEGIKQIPYVLRYGQPCRAGLTRMNLPPDLLRTLETEEYLEGVMDQAVVITAGTAQQSETVAAVAQKSSTDSQPPRQKSKGRKESLPAHQPSEYELKVLEKRRKNQEYMNELGLGLGMTQTGKAIVPQLEAQSNADPYASCCRS
jgi:hypothetical protein